MASDGRVHAPDYAAFVAGLNDLRKHTQVELVGEDDIFVRPMDRDWTHQADYELQMNYSTNDWELVDE